MPRCRLDFGHLSLEAELFETPVASRFYAHLPCTVELTMWGRELYGPVEKNLGEHQLAATIPPGGLAYTTKGSYFCLFFGQEPAWPVDYIGQIQDNSWKKLLDTTTLHRVIITRAE